MIKLNFWIDEDEYKKFKKYCIECKESMSSVLRDLVKEELKSVSSSKI